MARAKKNFSPEYRDEAVKMVIETSRPVAVVARELGLNGGASGDWVNATAKTARARNHHCPFRNAHGFVS